LQEIIKLSSCIANLLSCRRNS